MTSFYQAATSSSSSSPSRVRYPQFINSERQAPGSNGSIGGGASSSGTNNGQVNADMSGNANVAGTGATNVMFNVPSQNTDSPPPVYAARRSQSRTRNSPPRKVLGAIDENGGMAPDIPRRSSKRPNGFASFAAFLALFSTEPPKGEFEDVIGPNGEKFEDVRQNKPIPGKASLWQRRKWWIIGGILLLLALAIGLGVGLGVGLSNKNNGSSTNSSFVNTTDPNAITTFPAGAYSITTFLSVVTTGCTPNPSTWRCYPYQTYSQSQSGSQAQFQWIITGRKNSSGVASYNVSTANNPFMPSFSNTPLTLQNANTSNEYYGFTITLPVTVIPNVTITSDGSAAQCNYTNTQFTARLFTQKAKSYSSSSSSNSSMQSATVAEWPYAADVTEMSNSASNVPYCQKLVNGVPGQVIDIGTTSGGTCECGYMNYGT